MGKENSRNHLTIILDINPIEIKVKRMIGERTGRFLKRVDGIYKFYTRQASRPRRRKLNFLEVFYARAGKSRINEPKRRDRGRRNGPNRLDRGRRISVIKKRAVRRRDSRGVGRREAVIMSVPNNLRVSRFRERPRVIRRLPKGCSKCL